MPVDPLHTPPATDNLRGALLLMGAIALFTVEAGIVRALADQSSAAQAVFFRSIGQFVVVLTWAAWRGSWPNLRSRRYGLHIARGLLSITSWWLYYVTFQKLTVALATVLTYASSLFVVIFAGPLLGEKVKPVSWLTTLIGFAGIAIATDVLAAEINIYVWIGILSAACSAGLVLMTRALAQSEDTVTIMTFIGLFVLPASAVVAGLTWQPISMQTTLSLLASGTLGAIGMVVMIEAFAIAEAAVLAPIPYIRIVFAIALGYAAFGEVPSVTMLVGTMIVVTAALVALRAERR